MKRPRVALVGVGGYGRVHLRHLVDFHHRGELHLSAAVVLPTDAEPALSAELASLRCEPFASFPELLRALPRLRIDLAIVPTPIHLHAPMTEALLRAGVHVLLEKPLTASPAEATRIMEAEEASGALLAVGYQYLHAPEVQALKRRVREGAIGNIRRATILGAWPRPHAYYQRNGWAGRQQIDGTWVLDSPVNNAMAHFVMLMFYVCDCPAFASLQLRGELYRAQAIETYDTAAFALTTETGCQLEFYGTHSAESLICPTLRLEGTHGEAEWKQDQHAWTRGTGGEWRQDAHPESATRETMLRDVMARWRGEPAFYCSSQLAAVHVDCVWALHSHVPIVDIPRRYTAQCEEADGTRTFVPGLGDGLHRAAQRGCSLREANIPWAAAPTRCQLGATNPAPDSTDKSRATDPG